MVDFEDFFIVFHEVLFRNDDWIFDPNLDPIINTLPSEYFLACFGIFVGTFTTNNVALAKQSGLKHCNSRKIAV